MNIPERKEPDDDVGDVEAAGETTAAAVAGGTTNQKPVGADTLVEVEGETDQKEPGERTR